MKILFVFTIIVATATIEVKGDERESGLLATFSIGLWGKGDSFMYDLPRNESDAIADDWIEMTAPEGIKAPYSDLKVRCYPGFFVCMLYDDAGYIAGIQTSFPKNNITGAVFNLTKQGFNTWTITEDGVSTEYWYTRMYFIDEENLASSAEERIAAYDSTKILQYGGLWVTGFDGDLIYISQNITEIINNSSFTEQGCFVWMGRHHYWNMSADTPCASESVLPYFIYRDQYEVVGVAPWVVGKINVGNSFRDNFEYPLKLAVEMIVPKGPQWLYDFADDPGISTLHYYLISDPRTLLCLGGY